MMKLKLCSSSVAKSIVNATKVGNQNNMLRATSFSSINHNPQNINNNKVDAPFAKAEPEVRRIRLDDDDRNNEAYQKRKEHKSTTEEATGYVADKAKSGTKSAVETTFQVGEKVAEGLEQTFGTVKETTQKVKDTIVGNYDDENGNNTSRGSIDKHVEDLRNKAGGYDQRSQ